MNQREAMVAGRDNGYSCAEVNYTEGMTAEALTEVAYEAEDNARQYTPFEFFAHEINETGDRAEGIWNAYDEGVGLGIKKFIRERKIA